MSMGSLLNYNAHPALFESLSTSVQIGQIQAEPES